MCLSAVIQVEMILPREWVGKFLISLWAVAVWFPSPWYPSLQGKWRWKLKSGCCLPVMELLVSARAERGQVYLNKCSLLSFPPITCTSHIQHFLHVFAEFRIVPACLGLIWKWQLQEQEKITSKKPSSSQNASRGSIDIYVCSAVDTFISLVITTSLALPLFLGSRTIYAMWAALVLYRTAQIQSSPSGGLPQCFSNIQRPPESAAAWMLHLSLHDVLISVVIN